MKKNGGLTRHESLACRYFNRYKIDVRRIAMSQPEPLASPEPQNFLPRLYGVVLLVAVIVLAGIWLIARFTAADLNRDMQSWQEKLNLISESRTSEMNNWVSGHFRNMRSLANNPSLQLYLGELQTDGKKSGMAVEPAQKSYLRNLLLFTADQAGFGGAQPVEPVKANVQKESKNGLAVIGANNEIVVSTSMPPAVADLIAQHARNSPSDRESLIDLQKDSDGTPYIGFIVPVFSIQGDRSAQSLMGKVIGIKMVDDAFFSLLKHPGSTEESMEIILTRTAGSKLEYLSPLKDGSGALVKQIDANPEKSADAELSYATGRFVTDKQDYRGKNVLATSRPVANTPWKLITKIDKQEALSESTDRRIGMVVVFFLIIAVVALIVATVWWQANSRRALLMSRHFRKLAAQTQAHEQLLMLVTNHQPEPVFIVDTRFHYHFANHRAALESGMAVDFMMGKTLNDVRGTARAGYIQEQCDKAIKHKRIIYDMARVQGEKGERIVRSAFVPLDHIPVITLPDPTPGVLVVEQDISEVVHERERRLETQNHLIQTLVRLVDKRDPFAANHSLLVSQVAHKIAADMELHNAIVETARISGCLMNIGKIVIPTDLLTKNKSLTADEKRTVQESMLAAADLVRGIDFDGPVTETLKQWQEKWDGTGPLGLRGEAILISARIIAVANAFIGMISPRSWRTAIPIESATKFLLDQSDAHFDRRVVIALINYIDNHHGRAWIEQILAEQRNAAA